MGCAMAWGEEIGDYFEHPLKSQRQQSVVVGLSPGAKGAPSSAGPLYPLAIVVYTRSL